MKRAVRIPGLGIASPEDGWISLESAADQAFRVGQDGVRHILATGDRKVELIAFANHTLAHVRSALGHPAYYPLRPVRRAGKVQAVLMDLDGTTVHSEAFWIGIIEKSVQSLLEDAAFTFAAEDIPFVSGHSISEHLRYAIGKYTPHATLAQAREWYTRNTAVEMDLILQGKGIPGAFRPAPGIKDFLLALKTMGIKIALVTSGLYRKAYPEILSAFQTLEMGDPQAFYDCIITAGNPLEKGSAGTLGELAAKPHPWLYAEACRVGLDIPPEERGSVVGIEDSGAGVCALRLAGYYTVGIAGGNIPQSGALGMCNRYCDTLDEILAGIREDTL